MKREFPRLIRSIALSVLSALAVAAFPTVFSGCGSGEETMKGALPYQDLGRLHYQNDSLVAENSRLRRQLDALVSENSMLTRRVGELEVRLKDMQTAQEAPPTDLPSIADMSAAYSDALAQYRARDFAGAISRFEQLIENGIQSDLADNCRYWIGECFYGMRKYGDAVYHFEKVLEFSHSDKKDDSMLMIGNSYSAIGQHSTARTWYNRLIDSYPASPYLLKAQEKLAGLRE